MTGRLTPTIAADRLYPKDAAYMARTDLHETRMLGLTPVQLDTVTIQLLGLLNGHTTVRHRSGVTDEGLRALELAGLTVDEDMRIYDSPEEAEQHADRLIKEGKKLFWPYLLREGRFADSAHLVSPRLYRRLNSKQHLDRLVPAENLPPRTIIAIELMSEHPFERPVYVKAGGDAPTALGYAVRYCETREQWLSALEWFRSAEGVRDVIVEDAVPVKACWCASIVIERNQTLYGGAAEQMFSVPGKQSGSVIDVELPFPKEGVELAIKVGEAARKEGFVGIAGLDIGLSDDGRLVVFDPNFRFNASSGQVLFHESAARRGGFSASCSIALSTALPLREMIETLSGAIEGGWFVPLRFIDGALLSAANGASSSSGFVLGRDRAAALARRRELLAMFNT